MAPICAPCTTGRNATIVYVFAVWVRMFSVVTVTQGWVTASNLFTSREAKRVYGMLGMGMIVGAILGGAVLFIGPAGRVIGIAG